MTRVLVTGGGGFLGGALVRALLDRGFQVRSFARGAYPDLERRGVRVLRGDLADADAVEAAAADCEAVFHVAAKAGIWGSDADFEAANVLGTRHILAACRKHGVGKLIYTSTPSVVQTAQGCEGLDESQPYPETHMTAYGRTKARAEREVMAASDDALATVSLRPRLIWGPGDTQLLPRLVQRAQAGRLRKVGKADPLVDSLYIDNAVHAHLLAFERLHPGAACAGRAYFVTQGEPTPMYGLINRMLAAAGQPPVTRTIPPSLAWAAGCLLEPTWTLLRLHGEPPMTRFLARQLSTPNWFDISAIRRDLGYAPLVSIDDGLQELARWWQREGGQR